MRRLSIAALLACIAFASFEASAQQPVRWPKLTRPPEGLESAPGPWSDPDDPTIWPNQTSNANSDSWIAENHDAIREMRPRALLINFSNEHSPEFCQKLAAQLFVCLEESSRYHGYRNANAPAFLRYQTFKFVDLRDDDRKMGESRKVPVKNPKAKQGFNFDYKQLFSDQFAEYYGVRDPRDPKRFLRLDELVDAGYVHEVFFFVSGRAPEDPHVGAFEVVEEKPRYDEKFRRIGNEWVQAGNGGDSDQPWTGRSLRIGCINASRGVGCYLESLGHGLEGCAKSGAIPYFSKYFKEFAGFDLDRRYGVPFSSLYGANLGRNRIEYDRSGNATVPHGEKRVVIKNYVAIGGNAHFPPNGRSHYDLDHTEPVLSTIEDWRIGSDGGKDRAEPWTNAKFEKYRKLAPDCMGAWLVYWRQNMPGLDNLQKDDEGKPMKNWMPFLFY